MKFTKIVIVAIFILEGSYIFAGNTETKSSSNWNVSSSLVLMLAPTAPSEATFEDEISLTDLAGLAPVTPLEAEFSDAVPEAGIDIYSLAPVTPLEADFNGEINQDAELSVLIPVTPAEADF